MHSERAPFFLKLAAWGGVVFLHFPILIIAAYAFNTEDAAFSFPPQGLTLRWFSVAAQRSDILDAVTLSLKVAALATLIALVLGTLAAAALWRRDFFGKNARFVATCAAYYRGNAGSFAGSLAKRHGITGCAEYFGDG